MTQLDELRDLLTHALLYRRFERVHEALLTLGQMTPLSEMQMRLAEEYAELRSILGQNAQLTIEFTMSSEGSGVCYSVGFGSKHAHTFDVHGRGATLREAIDAALKHPR